MKILLTIDGSSHSDAVVSEFCRQTWPQNADVRMLTVDSPFDAGLLRRARPGVLDEIIQQVRADSLLRLNQSAAAIRQAAPQVNVTPIYREGWPKEVILEEAEKWGADLIVVGARNSGAIGRYLIGSVALAVAANARCSVQIIRPPIEPAG